MSRGYHVNRHPRRHYNSSNVNYSRKAPLLATRSDSSRSGSYLADDENYPLFKAQLAKLGLELRDIPADGNCLFSALGDQLDGSPDRHQMHRQSVCEYIVDHRNDFEPFMEDDTPFETHVKNLSQLGTYGGNEVIVAFCRLHRVNVVIHQLGRDPWQICGTEEARTDATAQQRRQLHIAYHNGDHYSSVRKVGDSSSAPSNIRIPFDFTNAHNSSRPGFLAASARRSAAGARGGRQALGDLVDRIHRRLNEYFTHEEVREALDEADYDEDATVAYLCQLKETDLPTGNQSASSFPSAAASSTSASASANNSNVSGIWSPGGTGTRVFGGGAADLCRSGAARPAAPKKASAKQLKKERATERRRAERLAGCEPSVAAPSKASAGGGGGGGADEYIIQGVHAIQI